MKRIFTAIAFLGIVGLLQAQNYDKVIEATNVDFLLRWAEEQAQKDRAELERAKRFCEENGYPTVVIDDEGRKSEVIGFDDAGQLVYAIEDNVDAAKTIRLDRIQSFGLENYNLTGRDMTAGMWEGGNPRSTHQELFPRVIIGNSIQDRDHATHVAGTIIAQGVESDAKGMANEARVKSFLWSNVPAAMANEAANGMLVSNHSWGQINGWATGNWSGNNGWHWWGTTSVSQTEDYQFGRYDTRAQSWDVVAFNAPYFTIVKSAGNQRNENGPGPGGQHFVRNSSFQWVSSTATRDPDGDFDCQGNMTLAKNALSIGAVNALPNGWNGPNSVSMSGFSSWGPSDDGRIKPDLVGNGVGVFSSVAGSNTSYGSLQGTSMSAPTITGAILLLQEHHSNLNNGDFMRSATVKSLLINTSDEAGANPGPDYIYGWGLPNIRRAARIISDEGRRSLIEEDTLFNNQVDTYQVYSDGTEPLTVSIAWLDPAGAPGPVAVDFRGAMLINDLDLRVISPNDTTLPWKLDPDNPTQAATQADNLVDNVEVVEIPNPNAGTYTITIAHKGQLSGTQQTYSLVVDGVKTQDSLLYCQPLHEFNSFYGEFTDGGNSPSYESNQSCNWKINGAPFSRIELHFSEFDLESNADFVTVYDGPDNSSPVLGTFTGNTIPATVKSTSNSMFVSFTSDNNDAGNSGFKAIYISTTCASVAGLPEAGFVASVLPGDTCDREIRFIRGAEKFDSLRWFYGDGSTSTTTAPIHTYQYSNGGTYDISQVAYGKCFLIDTFTQEFTVPCFITGVEELEEIGVKLYPNPTSSDLFLDFESLPKTGYQFEIMDLNGRVLKSRLINTNQMRMDISDLSEGIYFYRISGDKLEHKGKIIKN